MLGHCAHYNATSPARRSGLPCDFDLFALDDDQPLRIVDEVLVEPATFVTSPQTQQPILCDDMTTASDDSCTVQILAAMLDAMTFLETSGKLHGVDIAPRLPIFDSRDVPGALLDAADTTADIVAAGESRGELHP